MVDLGLPNGDNIMAAPMKLLCEMCSPSELLGRVGVAPLGNGLARCHSWSAKDRRGALHGLE